MVVAAGCFFVTWYVNPSWLTGRVAVSMASAPTLVLAVGLYLFRSLSNLNGVGLSEREANNLVWRKAEIRRRLYRVGGFALATSAVLAFIVALELQATTPLLALMTGALIGLMFQYLIVLVRWIEQLSTFRDDQERRAVVARQRENSLKALKG